MQLFLVSLALLLVLAACGQNENSSSSNRAGNDLLSDDQTEQDELSVPKLNVVTSFYPLYYIASEIGGKYVQVSNLIAAGVEPHDWTPKSRDLSTASNAQLLLYHGAGLEQWIEQFQKGLSKDSEVVVKEMSLGISLINGDTDLDQDHEEHEHEEQQKDEGHSEHTHLIDPHTWVSPKSAVILAENVKYSLIEADPVNEDYYSERYEELKNKLIQIDNTYTETFANVSQRNMVVSHQAFGYLARDYNLKQVSIMGLSPDAEPRAQDILRIAKFVKENNVSYIFFEELVSDQLARTLANEAKVETMVLNPLEGLTKEQEKAGETYLTLMERNLQNLNKALQ